MEPEIATLFAQFGVAGLIGWMWLTERRSALQREQQLTQAHDALTRDRQSVEILLKALDANTRAITSLEASQQRLIAALERTPLDLAHTSPNQNEQRAHLCT